MHDLDPVIHDVLVAGDRNAKGGDDVVLVGEIG